MSDAGMIFLGAVIGSVATTVAAYYIASPACAGSLWSRAPAAPRASSGGAQWYAILYKEPGPRARIWSIRGPYATRDKADREAARNAEVWYPKVRRLTYDQASRL
jgi:hypothetical protein